MTGTAAPRQDTVLFGDPDGIAQLLNAGRDVLAGRISAICAASIRKSQHAVMERIAGQYGVPLLIQPRPADEAYTGFRNTIAGLAPKLGLCNSYSMIIRPDLLDVFGQGIANLHGAPLPECRGANPVEWTIIRDESLAGASLHWMDEGTDTGPVISRFTTQILFTDTWRDVRRRVQAMTMPLLREALPGLMSGTVEATMQDESKARSFPRRGRADGAFRWDWPARRIYNMVRALVAPHPGAVDETGAIHSSYLSPAEILAAKASRYPANLTSHQLRIHPLLDRTPVHGGHARPGDIPFLLTRALTPPTQAPLAAGTISLDDWARGTCSLTMEAAPAFRRAAETCIAAFMEREFSLALRPASQRRRIW